MNPTLTGRRYRPLLITVLASCRAILFHAIRLPRVAGQPAGPPLSASSVQQGTKPGRQTSDEQAHVEGPGTGRRVRKTRSTGDTVSWYSAGYTDTGLRTPHQAGWLATVTVLQRYTFHTILEHTTLETARSLRRTPGYQKHFSWFSANLTQTPGEVAYRWPTGSTNSRRPAQAGRRLRTGQGTDIGYVRPSQHQSSRPASSPSCHQACKFRAAYSRS